MSPHSVLFGVSGVPLAGESAFRLMLWLRYLQSIGPYDVRNANVVGFRILLPLYISSVVSDRPPTES